MRWDDIQVCWMEFRPRAKRRWMELSEAQLDVINGNRELLADSLQASYGLPREVADEEILAWCTTFGEGDGPAKARPTQS